MSDEGPDEAALVSLLAAVERAPDDIALRLLLTRLLIDSTSWPNASAGWRPPLRNTAPNTAYTRMKVPRNSASRACGTVVTSGLNAATPSPPFTAVLPRTPTMPNEPTMAPATWATM